MPLSSFPIPRSAVQAEFPCAFGAAESVRRLRAATLRSVFQVALNDAAVGTVSEKRVALQRAIPRMGNSFKPMFFGSFVTVGDKVLLKGHFGIHWVVRLYTTLWLGGCIYAAVVGIRALLHGTAASPLLAGSAGILMFLGGLAFASYLRWLSRGDVAWLSNVIRAALEGAAPQQSHAPHE